MNRFFKGLTFERKRPTASNRRRRETVALEPEHNEDPQGQEELSTQIEPYTSGPSTDVWDSRPQERPSTDAWDPWPQEGHSTQPASYASRPSWDPWPQEGHSTQPEPYASRPSTDAWNPWPQEGHSTQPYASRPSTDAWNPWPQEGHSTQIERYASGASTFAWAQEEPSTHAWSQERPSTHAWAQEGPSTSAQVDEEPEIEEEQQEHVYEAQRDEGDEHVYEGQREEGDDDEGELVGPFPGGPTNPSLLPSFKTHIAAKIWHGREREPLKLHCHTNKLIEWQIQLDENTRSWRTLFRRSRLINLQDIKYPSPNRALVSAFVERWHPETNTFHMPFGEMTITLDDVHCLTGLPVTGLPIYLPANVDDGIEYVVDLLGVNRRDAVEEMKDAQGKLAKSVRLKWLKEKFSDQMTSTNPERREKAARAYIWYLMGCSLFPDKTGSRVRTNLLTLLEDFDDINKYAWGTACLAFLYRQLGLASRYGVKQMGGFIPLLEAWIYEHFSVTRPNFDVDYHQSQPLAIKWTPPTRSKGTMSKLIAYRRMLDSLTEIGVDWNPYFAIRHYHPLPPVAFYHGCISALNIVEPYYPNRVLRQFGYIQRIPSIPNGPTPVARLAKGTQEAAVNYFNSWQHTLVCPDQRRQIAHPAWKCSDDYLDWYHTHSHPKVENTNRRPDIAPLNPNDVNVQELLDMRRDSLGILQVPYELRSMDGQYNYNCISEAFNRMFHVGPYAEDQGEDDRP